MDSRRHPDVFSPREAHAYVLGSDVEFSERTLESWRSTHGLIGVRLTSSYYYHRRDLDALIDRLFSIAPRSEATPRRQLRMSEPA